MSIQTDSKITLVSTIQTGVPDMNGDIISPGAFENCALVIQKQLSVGELQELKAQWGRLFQGSSISTVNILGPTE